jgi:predicted small secreted protein
VSNNSPNPDNLKKLKTDYPDNLPVILQEKTALEAVCVKHTHDPVKSKAGVLITVELVGTKEISKNQTELEYAFKQEGNVIGKLIAKGSAAGAKSEDAEYEYSSGIMDLDGGSPLNYQIFNNEGCIVGRYFTEEKTLYLRKDNAQFKSGDIKKYYKGNIKARIDFVQAFANLLADKRFL